MTAFVATLAFLGSTGYAASPRVVITPAAGFTIAWDGNNGGFNSPNAGAGPSDNIALTGHGTVPFASSDLGPLLGIPFHVAANLNDGLYGNSHSWISANGVGGASDADPYVHPVLPTGNASIWPRSIFLPHTYLSIAGSWSAIRHKP